MLLVFGLGYAGAAIAAAARAQGRSVVGTLRDPTRTDAEAMRALGIEVVAFDDPALEARIAHASAILTTARPDEGGDPVLARWGAALRAASPRWIGYCSTTGVYGDRGGGTVDETTAVAPREERAIRRVEAETAWQALAAAAGASLDLLRLAGIYGPGRSVFDDLREGRARHVVKPGHRFSRIHRDDIVHGALAAMARPGAPGVCRVLLFADDEPAEQAAVVLEAARLLGVVPPPPVPFEKAWRSMSPMARSFWADNRSVVSAGTKAALGIGWRYPTYREGLAAILAEEVTQRDGEQGEIPLP